MRHPYVVGPGGVMVPSTACPDWERRIMMGDSLIPFGPMFPDEAAAAMDQFKSLRMVDIADAPSMGEISRPWMLQLAETIFGSYDADSGIRYLREALVLIAKKNSKSSSAAALMITLLLRNWRISAGLTILAPTVEIAQNSYKPASDMVRADPELSELLDLRDHTRTITHRVTGATLKVLAATDDTVGGQKASIVLVDELWLFGKRDNAENMLREATGGLASRPEGMVIYLTTQSDDPPAGVFKQKLQYARDVRDGVVEDPQFLPVLYEFPPKMIEEKAYLHSRNFFMTNPNMGASVSEDFLIREAKKAQNAGEDSIRGFMSKHLNVEIGLALRSNRWAGADHWEGAERPLTLDSLIEKCEVITVGIDGGGLDDLLALSFVGREPDSKRWLSVSHAWAHHSVLERYKDTADRLRGFVNDGHLSIVSHLGEDIVQLAEMIVKVFDAGLLDRVGVDPAAIGAILDALSAARIPDEKILGVSQGWRMTGAIKTVERKIADGTMINASQPMMRWCVGNAKAEPKGNAVMITKQGSGRGKIDPLMSLFNAASLMSTNPAAAKGKFQVFIFGK